MNAQRHGLGHAQRALLGTITEGLNIIEEVQSGLDRKTDLPSLGSDPVSFLMVTVDYC